jgi:hypothetical protein
MGQTSAEAKREVDQTRAHLTQTLDALQFKARRNLDVKTQVRENRWVQFGLANLVLVGAAVAAVMLLRRRRRSPAERLARRLKLDELRGRLSDFGEDAKAWAAAQKRIVRADSKSKQAEMERRETVARRLIVSASEAALTALAAGMVRRFVAGNPRHRSDRAAVSKRR